MLWIITEQPFLHLHCGELLVRHSKVLNVSLQTAVENRSEELV